MVHILRKATYVLVSIPWRSACGQVGVLLGVHFRLFWGTVSVGLVPSGVHPLRELSEKTFVWLCENVPRVFVIVRARKIII